VNVAEEEFGSSFIAEYYIQNSTRNY
jgi:hypothetical protein